MGWWAYRSKLRHAFSLLKVRWQSSWVLIWATNYIRIFATRDNRGYFLRNTTQCRKASDIRYKPVGRSVGRSMQSGSMVNMVHSGNTVENMFERSNQQGWASGTWDIVLDPSINCPHRHCLFYFLLVSVHFLWPSLCILETSMGGSCASMDGETWRGPVHVSLRPGALSWAEPQRALSEHPPVLEFRFRLYS